MHATGNATATEGNQQTERTRSTMSAYLDALVARSDYGRFFSDDVTFTMMDTGEVTARHDAVVGLIDYLHAQAFDATVVVKRLIVDGNQAVLEAEFVGTHAAEFAGIAATGRSVKLPYAVGYDVDGDAITALRIYLSMDALIRQIREG